MHDPNNNRQPPAPKKVRPLFMLRLKRDGYIGYVSSPDRYSRLIGEAAIFDSRADARRSARTGESVVPVAP